MGSRISQFILKLLGWKIINHKPDDVKTYVVVVAPHTSNWDFPLGLLVRSALKEKISFVGKKSLFKPPLGFIFRALGGVPVDRSKNTNLVDAIVDLFEEREEFAICITPEGTRKKVEKLKSGYYYVAKGAKIPVILCKFDFEHRQVVLSEPHWVGDDKNEEIEYLRNYFSGVKGKIPENGIS